MNFDNSSKSNDRELDPNLEKVVKGSGIIFIGNIIGTIFGLIGVMLIARFYSVGEYGLYGLGIFVISFFLRISSLGLGDGCPRYISYYRGKKDYEKVRGTINTSLIIISISSSVVAILLFFLSDFIANKVFGIEELSSVIKIFAIGLPFWAIINLVVGIFRGFESTKENVYFTNLSLRLLKIPFFTCVILLGLSFNYIIVVYTLSIIITFFITIFYLVEKLPGSIKEIKKAPLQIKTLLSFSLPLAFSGLGWFLILGADKLMLGILKSEEEVGLYNAATVIAQYLMFFLITTNFIFQPVATRLFAEKKMDELKRNYQILTKWLFTATFPFIIFLLLFPETAIIIIFGEKYTSVTMALRLLTLAYLFHLAVGPNGATIAVLGKTRMMMYFTLIGGSINLVLNYFLIPSFGIEGAALSTMISLIIINVFNGVYLYKISSIHPVRKKYMFLILTAIVLLVTYFCFQFLLHIDISIIFEILVVFIITGFYLVIMLMSKSYDEEDLQLLILIERKVGFKFKTLRKIIKKFI